MVPVSVHEGPDAPTGAQMTACFVDLPVGEPGPSMRLHQIAFSMRQQMEGGSRRAVNHFVRVQPLRNRDLPQSQEQPVLARRIAERPGAAELGFRHSLHQVHPFPQQPQQTMIDTFDRLAQGLQIARHPASLAVAGATTLCPAWMAAAAMPA